jgi:hypothetical protein
MLFSEQYIVLRYISSSMDNVLHLSDYQALAELRHQIRRFLHFSEQAARDGIGTAPTPVDVGAQRTPRRHAPNHWDFG